MLALIATMHGLFMSLFEEREDGQGMVEYGMIIALISIALVIAFQTTNVSGAITALGTVLVSNITP